MGRRGRSETLQQKAPEGTNDHPHRQDRPRNRSLPGHRPRLRPHARRPGSNRRPRRPQHRKARRRRRRDHRRRRHRPAPTPSTSPAKTPSSPPPRPSSPTSAPSTSWSTTPASPSDGLALRMKLADLDDVLRTNLTGAFLLTQAVISSMMKARWGRIINITSVVGETGSRRPGQLRRLQGRPDRPHQVPRPRVRQPRHHRQRRRPRLHRDRHDRRAHRRPEGRHPQPKSRSPATAPTPTSPPPSPSSPPTPPATSPATPSTSTAACTWANAVSLEFLF